MNAHGMAKRAKPCIIPFIAFFIGFLLSVVLFVLNRGYEAFGIRQFSYGATGTYLTPGMRRSANEAEYAEKSRRSAPESNGASRGLSLRLDLSFCQALIFSK